jgi:hypothetical protein
MGIYCEVVSGHSRHRIIVGGLVYKEIKQTHKQGILKKGEKQMKSPREIRKARLAFIKSIVREIKDQLGCPGVKIYAVWRDMAGMSSSDTDNQKTGYGIGFLSFFWREKEKRIVEIDCASDGTSLESSLVVETFDDEVFEKVAPVIERFRLSQEMKELFGGIESKNYGRHVSEFDQMVGACRESLSHMMQRED